MVDTRFVRLLGMMFIVAVLGVPASASAQSSTSYLPFTATLVNPCTRVSVGIAGVATVVVNQTVQDNGAAAVSVKISSTGGAVTLSGPRAAYSFTEVEDYSFMISGGPQPTDSSLLSKLYFKPLKGRDRWRATAAIAVGASATGQVTSVNVSFAGAVCMSS
jgi:hypothetical protein